MALTNETGTILRNDQVGPNLYLLEVESPDIARRVEPGQFVHTKIPGMEGHILRRPFSVYAADPPAGTFEVLYQDRPVRDVVDELMQRQRRGEADESWIRG